MAAESALLKKHESKKAMEMEHMPQPKYDKKMMPKCVSTKKLMSET